MYGIVCKVFLFVFATVLMSVSKNVNISLAGDKVIRKEVRHSNYFWSDTFDSFSMGAIGHKRWDLFVCISACGGYLSDLVILNNYQSV